MPTTSEELEFLRKRNMFLEERYESMMHVWIDRDLQAHQNVMNRRPEKCIEAGGYRYVIAYDKENDQITLSQRSLYGSHGTLWIDWKDAHRLSKAINDTIIAASNKEPA